MLISKNPEQWPKKCDSNDIDFSEFRTIDAQDLIKVVNTVSENKISETYIAKYNDLRKIRNSTCHTVDTRQNLKPKQILVAILDTIKEFFPNSLIVEKRKEALKRTNSFIDEHDGEVQSRISQEIHILIQILTPSEMKYYFDFDKKRRRYICPSCQFCSQYDSFEYPIATLISKELGETELICVACNSKFNIIRKKCNNKDCKGDVLYKSNDGTMCLTCGLYQE